MHFDELQAPHEYGLPYKEWRSHQPEPILALINTGKRVRSLIAPTGSGKSAIAATVHRATHQSAIVLTKNKSLQYQYRDTFPFIASIEGMDNFWCRLDDVKVSSAACQLGFMSCPHKDDDCEYFIQRAMAEKSQMIVTNYAYAMNALRSPNAFIGNMHWLVADEGHLLDEELTSHVTIELHQKQLESLGGVPKVGDDPIKWRKWAESKWDEWKTAFFELESEKEKVVEILNQNRRELVLHQVPQQHRETIRQYFRVRAIKNILEQFQGVDNTWVVSLGDKVTRLRPLWVADKAKEFFKGWQDILIMSATLPKADVLSTLLGLDKGSIYEHELDSVFPASDRQVFYSPVAKMSRDTEDEGLTKIVPVISALLDRYPNDKVLIHTNSGKLQMAIVNMLPVRFKERVAWHDTMSRNAAIKKFVTTTQPTVMISPSMESGVDVPDLRIQIIVKVLWEYLGDPWTYKRSQVWPDWFYWKTTTNMTQAIGRVPRVEGLQCATYILDSNFGNVLWPKAEHMFPRYVRDAIVWPK